jgi:hypothetical protein
MHPDVKVRDALALIFDKFEELGSARQVVRWSNRHGFKFPACGRGHIDWVRATTSRMYRIFRNPAYAGIYVYGQTVVDESRDRDTRGRTRRRSQPPSEWVYLEGNHAAYVTPASWVAIQARLSSNKRIRVSPIGRGGGAAPGYRSLRGTRQVHVHAVW